MHRFDWQYRLNAALAIFATVFVGALAAVLAVWLVAAVALGTVELVRRFA